ncbi:MAG: SRPBCC domain-containing protein [Candidatus Pacebacteria bacterium]|nr:SRPBCC domain-containing protein [Candidatus Paceibacterota bacterium]
MSFETFTAEVVIKSSIEKVWEYFTNTTHIGEWANASPDWETVAIKNDLVTGGEFLSRMQAKDGSQGFDFGGVYDEVVPLEIISYTMGDERKASTTFSVEGDSVRVAQEIDAETENPIDMQKSGWQAMLDNLKNVVESN